MKKWVFLMLFFGFLQTSFAHYSRPYRVTFNPVNKSYLITNRGNGTIIQVDSFYKTSTVITGLVDPRDLALGTFAGTAGLLVVDDNKIVVYDAASFQKLISYAVAGASDLHDIEIDADNTGYFYLSDAGNNKILKGKVGPAPFYTPTYKVLSQHKIHRPKGMMYSSKGELLVVSDSLQGEVYKVDTSSGNTSLLFRSGLDSLNHLAQDKEGNYYFTNWSNSYLYRTDANFASLTKQVSYNKPAGMYINASTDLMLLVCHLCNKLEFNRLHSVEPKAAVYTCARDSFSADVDIQYNGIGTYLSGNNFLLELSDNNGSFSKPTVIGRSVSTTKPQTIKGYMAFVINRSGLKYRIRSTNPSIVSQAFDFNVLETPNASNFVEDSLFVCKGGKAIMAKATNAAFQFTWSPATFLDSDTISQATFEAVQSGSFIYKLHIENSTDGCSDSGNVHVEVMNDIKLSPWKSKLETCENVKISIGGNQVGYTYTWSSASQLSDSTIANPTFGAKSSAFYRVLVEDPISGCKGKDSVEVTVIANPVIELISGKVATCANTAVQIGDVNDATLTYKWASHVHLSDSNKAVSTFKSIQPGSYTYALRATNAFGCKKDTSVIVENNAYPIVNDFKVTGIGYPDTYQFTLTSDAQNKVELFWDSAHLTYTSLAVLANSRDTTIELETPFYFHRFFAKITSDKGCIVYTDTVTDGFMNAKDLTMFGISVYPNPIKSELTISDKNQSIQRVRIYDMTGKQVVEVYADGASQIEIPMQSMKNGMYNVRLESNHQIFTMKIIKQE